MLVRYIESDYIDMWPGGEAKEIAVGSTAIGAGMAITYRKVKGFVEAKLGDTYCGVALEYGNPGDTIVAYMMPWYCDGRDSLVNEELSRLGWQPHEIRRAR